MPADPTELYHYTQFHPDRLRHIIRQSKIYCSNPSTFNDPWDCKPSYYIPEQNEVEYCNRCVEWFCASWQIHFGKTTEEIERRAEFMRTNRKAFEHVLSEFSEHFSRRLSTVYRVCCLSATATNTLLWSHYAKHHTGIALEFNRRNTMFRNAIRVRYVDSYPKFDVTQEDDASEVLPIFYKSSAWSYEQEYRLVTMERDKTDYVAESLRSKNGYLFIPSGVFTSIILGCNFPDDEVKAIKSIARERIPAVTVKRARRLPNNYKLVIEPL